ncbi:unnamed protein product, partial [Aphanomyces euteiches]
ASISSPWPCNVVRFTRCVTLPTSSVTRPVLPHTLLQPRIWMPSSPRSGTRMRSLWLRVSSVLPLPMSRPAPSQSRLSTKSCSTPGPLLALVSTSPRAH